MPDPFIGQIMMFGGTFAPRGWALCDGQLLAIAQNQALFSILGTTYGGDGRTTFALPDLRGRMAMHPGAGPRLSPRRLGEKRGEESVTLDVNQMPSHTHHVNVTNQAATSTTPAGKICAGSHATSPTAPVDTVYGDLPNPPSETMAGGAITGAGGNQAHDNLPPFQCVNYIIALIGVFPARN